jgi:hypothetical protein
MQKRSDEIIATERSFASGSSASLIAASTSWFKDWKYLWVKLVAAPPVSHTIRPTDLQASITVSR